MLFYFYMQFGEIFPVLSRIFSTPFLKQNIRSVTPPGGRNLPRKGAIWNILSSSACISPISLYIELNGFLHHIIYTRYSRYASHFSRWVNSEVVFMDFICYYYSKKKRNSLCQLDNDVVRRNKKHGNKEKERGNDETGE